ncbi:MAG: right-handed parallel beta-helix repeat-containing protein [Planctomycetes bacterium]|nr:right-handed parallel beta-helix repeat-containing protein [Planctomycetota bacterium]
MLLRLKSVKQLATITVLVFTATANATIYNVPGDYATIQEAIAAVKDGDEIVVAPGTYNEAIDFLGKPITIISSGGAEVTTIDGTGLNTSVVSCINLEGADTVLEGFTITGGNALDGGGMYNQFSDPTVTSCRFIQNAAISWGGGMYNSFSDPTLSDCVFSSNSAVQGGGMVVSNESNPTISDCTFSGNTASEFGGGIRFTKGSYIVTNCTFVENIAEGFLGGGAIWVFANQEIDLTVIDSSFIGNSAPSGRGGAIRASTLTASGCSFIDNSAGLLGGALYLNGDIFGAPAGSFCLSNCLLAQNDALFGGGIFHESELSILSVANCTVTNNTAGIGGGILTDDLTVLFLDNSILWDNQPEQLLNDDISVVMVSYSNIQGGWPGLGNINANPLFVDPDNDDYRLAATSPCIDAANNNAVPKGIETDLGGDPRFVDDPDTPDTGVGTPPLVDMGAYEFQLVACPWDLDGDGSVGISDLLHLFGNWGSNPGNPADFDKDGFVNTNDLLILFANWGPCP